MKEWLEARHGQHTTGHRQVGRFGDEAMVKMIVVLMTKAKAFLASDAVTGGFAIAAVISPAWLPMLTEVSTYAALLMPIFGVTWLLVQIYAKLKEIKAKEK